MKKFGLQEARRTFPTRVEEAQYENVTTLLLRNGKPAAKIAPIWLSERDEAKIIEKMAESYHEQWCAYVKSVLSVDSKTITLADFEQSNSSFFDLCETRKEINRVLSREQLAIIKEFLCGHI